MNFAGNLLHLGHERRDGCATPRGCASRHRRGGAASRWRVRDATRYGRAAQIAAPNVLSVRTRAVDVCCARTEVSVVAAKDSRSLGLAVVALVAFAAMLVWLLISPTSDAAKSDEAEPAASAPVPSAAIAPAAAAGTPAPAAKAATAAPAAEPALDVDLFAGPMPDFMTEAHTRTLDKKWLNVEMQKKLYQFGQEHKDDARPQLLLGWDSMNREWYGIAVRMYRIAYRADKRAKHDPSMLRDLLFVAGRYDKTEFREATAIIQEAYGEEALPRLDEEISAMRMQGNLKGSERLERVRKAITDP